MYSLVLLLLEINFFCSGQILTSEVRTDNGPLQGEIIKTFRKSIEFSSFRGIPYGKPPIGYARFKAPEEADPWSGIFQATSESSPCPQFANGVIGDEDCLKLNVYTPKTNFSINDQSLLPVLFWIHGGSFIIGFNNRTLYGPDLFIENGVLVVAINYRLGALGFLSLNLPNCTGNTGLKDQLLALKWVQKNIEVFGGDPNSVTIIGQSAGASCVDYHVLSDASKGFFHRSIAMSGSPLSLWAFSAPSEAESRAFTFGRELGIITDDKKKLLKALYHEPVGNLILAAEKMGPIDAKFKPTLENVETAGQTAFITKCSVDKYNSGNFSRLPHITGYTADEMLIMLGDSTLLKIVIDSSTHDIQTVNPLASSNLIDLFPEIIQAENITVNASHDTLKAVIHTSTNILFASGIDLKQRFMTKYTSPVYYYRHSFAPNISMHKQAAGINMRGAAHGDDVFYIFHWADLNFPIDPKDPVVVMQDRMSRMWSNFAKYSNPTPLGMKDPSMNISWPDSGPSGLQLQIDNEFSVVPRTLDINPIFFRALNMTLSSVQCDHTCSGSNSNQNLFTYYLKMVFPVLAFFIY